MAILTIIIVAIIIEGLVEWIKPIFSVFRFYKESEFSWAALLACAIGIVVCLFTATDIFQQVGIAMTVPYLGSILTGILVSRGSNFIHEFFERISTHNLN